MDVELAKYIATLGVGGVLAAFMFYFYRKDVKVYTELWRGQSDQLMQVVKENTAAITANTGAIHSMKDHFDAKN